MAENRCRRCNRVLMDPDAVYGWRCAKKLGVSRYMMMGDGAMWQYFYDGIAIGDIIIKNENLQLSYEEMLEMYDATIKWSLANGAGDDELMKLAYDKNFPLFLFIDLYKQLYGDINGEINQTTNKPNIHSLQKYLNLQNYTHDLGHRIDAVELINEYLTAGYVVLPDGSIIDNEHYDVKNPLMDFEVSFQRELLQPKQSDFDVGSFLWTAGGIANAISAGTLRSYEIVEKKKGKLNAQETKKVVKDFGKANNMLLSRNIIKYAGHLNKAYDVAYVTASVYSDYQDDAKFGEETVAAIASTVASGAAIAVTAPIAASFTLSVSGVAVITIVAGYLTGWIVDKGVEYFYSKKGQKEAEELSKNIIEALYNNPQELDRLVAELTESNQDIGIILQREMMIADEQVGEYILGINTDKPTHWLLTTKEYGLA